MQISTNTGGGVTQQTTGLAHGVQHASHAETLMGANAIANAAKPANTTCRIMEVNLYAKGDKHSDREKSASLSILR